MQEQANVVCLLSTWMPLSLYLQTTLQKHRARVWSALSKHYTIIAFTDVIQVTRPLAHMTSVTDTNSYGARYHATTRVYYSSYHSLCNVLVGTVVHAMQSVGTHMLTCTLAAICHCHAAAFHLP